MPKGRGRGIWAGLLTDTALIGMLMGSVLWIAWWSATPQGQRVPGGLLAAELVLGSLWYVLGWLRSCKVACDGTPTARMLVTRTRLTRWLSAALAVTLALAALGLILIACSAALVASRVVRSCQSAAGRDLSRCRLNAVAASAPL